ncbi:MAG TPA: PIN domain nuclease [Gaiellaceae bacterium]
MIVVDTSAWIDFLRARETPADLTICRLIAEEAPLAVTEVVVFELLTGVRSEREQRELRDHVLSIPVLPLNGLDGYEAAADLYRACRRGGETLRSPVDCLVAVPAIGAGATVLAADRDFEILARHTPLRLEPLSA